MHLSDTVNLNCFPFFNIFFIPLIFNADIGIDSLPVQLAPNAGTSSRLFLLLPGQRLKEQGLEIKVFCFLQDWTYTCTHNQEPAQKIATN